MSRKIHALELLVLCLVLLLGCGDTGSTSTRVSSGFAQGPITQFGSIFVNGVKFDTDGATFEPAGSVIDASNRPLGQVVLVEGTFDSNGTTGTATRVVFQSELKGLVEDAVPLPSPDSPTEWKLTVLGTTVIVEDGYTAFGADYDFDSIALFDVIEVSGLANGDGEIRATRIELEDTSDGMTEIDVELRGIAEGSSGAPNCPEVPVPDECTTTIGAVSVVYDASTQFEAGFDKAGFSSSVAVKVKGTFDPMVGSTTVRATEIKADEDIGEDLEKLSVEGFISGYTAEAAEFMVGSQRVLLDAGASISPPTLLSLDVNGFLVEVEGPLEGGVLRALKLKFEGEDLGVSAIIADGALGSDTLTLLGSVVISFDGGTRWEDKEDLAIDNAAFSFADLAVGDYVEVKGVDDGSGGILATRIEREDPDDPVEVELEGPAGAICAQPEGEQVEDPDPDAEEGAMITVPVEPCEGVGGEVWVEVLGIRVEIRETTDFSLDDVDQMWIVAEFIAEIGSNFVEFEFEPPGDAAPFVAFKAEIETPETEAP